jgi:hypothetical protein
LGKLVVADLDDDYPHLTPQNPAYPFWILDRTELKKRTGYTPVEALTEGFKHIDALISPNKLILSDWAETIPGLRGYWVPNYANWQWHKDANWQWHKDVKQKPLDENEIILGWGGSVSHWDSFWFSGIREALPVIFERYPQARFKLCGGDLRLQGMLEDIIPGRWFHQPGVPPAEWPTVCASFDIGLAPLCGPDYPQGERYDQRRSWLKAAEYLLTGVPWVASDGVVYADLDRQGGVCVPNEPSAWIGALDDMLENLSARKAESKKLMRWARDNLAMEYVVDDYVKIFDSIATDKHATTAARLPNIIYTADIEKDVDEIEAIEIEILDDDMQALVERQRCVYHVSTAWRKGLTLEYNGVDLAHCLQYPLLMYVNQAEPGETE